MYYTLPKRTRKLHLISELKETRRPAEPFLRDISDLIAPFRYKQNQADYQNPNRKTSKIYNSLGTKCLKVFQSGLMTCASDPTTAWLELTTKDPDRAKYGPHRDWLDEVGYRILQMIGDSDCYRNLPVGYGNLAWAGFFAMGLEENFSPTSRSMLSTRLYDTGRFWFAEDDLGSPNVFYEECRATVRQLYMRFGEDAPYSQVVKTYAEKGEWERWIDVCHLIEPNDDYEPGSPMGTRKRFSDCWFELGNASGNTTYENKFLDQDRYLYEGGFDLFPILIGKWTSVKGEVYPTEFPGSECISDNKSLQIGEKRIWQFIEKGVNPHWIVPAGLKGEIDGGFVPGDSSYVDEKDAGKSIRPAHIVDLAALTPMRENMDRVERRIMDSLHYPTFSMFDSIEDKERTATEIMERKAEKLLKLVDMYTNLQIGVLRPMVDYCFQLLVRNNLLPPVPPDLQGHALDYRFNGVLSQAQKMNRAQPINSLLNVVQTLAVAQGQAGVRPDVLDKFNTDNAIDEIATDWGVPSTIIRSDEDVAAIRNQRAIQQAQAAKLAALEQASQTAKNLGQAPLSGPDGEDNALGALVKK